ncbi:MAG: hypothetical protein IRY90_03675 [Actinomadura rubrobrunea]|nr:hypothetical protein [Actinomadura rubrobrunea]
MSGIRDDEVLLRVEDDGVGIPEGGRRGGMRDMAERAESLGRSFQTKSCPSGGTVVLWRAPVNDEASA